MSKAGFTIQPLDQTNYPKLVPLMKDVFGMTVEAEYFKWKYFDNPAGACIGYIAFENAKGEAVSFYGAMPQQYIVEGREATIYQACDTMTHTQFRKKGLYPILAKECYNQLQDNNNFFLIGIGGSEQSFPVLKFFGWRTVTHFRNYFKPAIFCRLMRGRKYSSGIRTGETPATIEPLFKNKTSGRTIFSARELPHYKWRVGNPNFKYKIDTYTENGKLTGYVVHFVQGDKILLFDFLFTTPRSGKALIGHLSGIVAREKYKGIVAFCQEGGAQSRELRRNMFVSNPFRKGPLSGKSPLLIFSEEETMNKYDSADKWELTAYDYDAL